MDQHRLYETIRNCGFTVLMFEDHPEFFGNWRAYIRRGGDLFEVVSDNREGWITLWKKENTQGIKLFEAESSKLDQEHELEILGQWLVELKKT